MRTNRNYPNSNTGNTVPRLSQQEATLVAQELYKKLGFNHAAEGVREIAQYRDMNDCVRDIKCFEQWKIKQ